MEKYINNILKCYRANGVVQGVGFRPFVHKLALDHNLTGWVLNDSRGVLFAVQGSQELIDNFIKTLKKNPPPLALITSVKEEYTKEFDSDIIGFKVLKSDSSADVRTIVPPDAHVCDECIAEVNDPANRRFQYPFINCTNCGPRYSIINGMPYDRPSTSMRDFEMCYQCNSEYSDIADRRYHAQPNACEICGPKLLYCDSNKIYQDKNILELARLHLAQGKILAIKSIGGFHLSINAEDEDAVNELRKRKKRDSKAFAVMVSDIETAKKYAEVSFEEEALLTSPQRPIVLLKKKNSNLPSSLAPNNPNLGVMLPSAPLHYLLFSKSDLSVVVMTSANISSYPTIYKNDVAVDNLCDIADYFLMNDRDIYTRNDDSVICHFNEGGNNNVSFIRRSKGYAPFPINVKSSIESVLAIGAELKTTLALSKGEDVYLSQHIGDLKNEESFSSLLESADKMQELLNIKPKVVAGDLHPGFHSTRYFEENSELPVIRVQHHHAHMASCMAENQLDEPVIGSIFDGTGYGLDGTIWGGEFLVGGYNHFERAGHLLPFSLLGGDKSVKEPIRVAVSLLHSAFGMEAESLPLQLYEAISEDEKRVFLKMADRKINTFITTSMGRLFDGVSSLIGVCHKINYDAQAVIELEGLLNKNHETTDSFSYELLDINGCVVLDHRPIIREIVHELLSGITDKALLSRRFHSTIVKANCEICHKISQKTGIKKVVLSGGVYMNEFLLSNTIKELSEKNIGVFNQRLVPSNDGGIALGQIMVANAQMNKF